MNCIFDYFRQYYIIHNLFRVVYFFCIVKLKENLTMNIFEFDSLCIFTASYLHYPCFSFIWCVFYDFYDFLFYLSLSLFHFIVAYFFSQAYTICDCNRCIWYVHKIPFKLCQLNFSLVYRFLCVVPNVKQYKMLLNISVLYSFILFLFLFDF